MAPTLDARDRLLVTAERLIGESGPSVSLREIATAAGQRNNSAVAYHFGSRDGLIESIIALRLDRMDVERMRLLADYETTGGPDKVADLVSMLVVPMCETAYAEGSTHYARFLEKVRDHPAVLEMPLAGDRWPATRMITARLDRELGHLTPAMRRVRLHALSTVMFALIADAERRGQVRRRAVREGIVDMLVGVLTAPVRSDSKV